jgi:nucleotide-binding universal stress UspA family protein
MKGVRINNGERSMNHVFGCIAGKGAPTAICDYAAWAALRLDAPLQLLHVLDRHPEVAPITDYSGSIGLGTQESLLAQLSALDEERSKIAAEHGRQLLEAARQRALAAGVGRVDVRQRHGTLIETCSTCSPRRVFSSWDRTIGSTASAGST